MVTETACPSLSEGSKGVPGGLSIGLKTQNTPHVPLKRHLVPPVPRQLRVCDGQLAIENPYEHLLVWFTQAYDTSHQSERGVRLANCNVKGDGSGPKRTLCGPRVTQMGNRVDMAFMIQG